MPPSASAAPDRSRVLYIHVMKTGGTTLMQHLRENIPSGELYPDPAVDMSRDPARPITLRHLTLPYLRRLPEERRREIRVYGGHFPFVAREAIGGDVTTLTILRHPVDRTISMLRQWSREQTNRTLDLEAVYELPEVYERLVHNHQTKIFSMTAEDDPMGYMETIHVDRSRLAIAEQHLAEVDVVGLFEEYEAFLDLVVERFGWHVDRSVRANDTSARNQQPVDDAFRARIAGDNAIDLEFYEFAARLVRERALPRHA